MKNGRAQVRKGAKGMDEFAQFLEDYGVRAIRGHNTDCVHAIADAHFEVKRQEISKPYPWMTQAIRDAGERFPIVAHRQNRKDWIAFLDLGDLLIIMKKAGMY